MAMRTINAGEVSVESGSTVVEFNQLSRDELMALVSTLVTPTLASNVSAENIGQPGDRSTPPSVQDLEEENNNEEEEETEEDAVSGFKYSLIREVCKRPNLWDTSNKDYVKKSARKSSWEDVAKALDEPLVDRCKDVWGKLSDYYGKQLLKKPRKPTGSGASKRAEPEPVWKYFAEMEFMRPVKKARRTDSNVKPKRGIPSAVIVPPESPVSALLSDADFPDGPVSPPSKKKLTRALPQHEGGSDDRLENSLNDLAGKLGAQLEKKTTRDDGGTILGDLVACAYSKLSVRRRLELRKAISDLLYEYEMQELDSNMIDYS